MEFNVLKYLQQLNALALSEAVRASQQTSEARKLVAYLETEKIFLEQALKDKVSEIGNDSEPKV